MNEMQENQGSEVSRITEAPSKQHTEPTPDVVSYANAQGYETTQANFTNYEQFYSDVEALTLDLNRAVPEIEALPEDERRLAGDVIADVPQIEELAANGDSVAMSSSVASEMFSVKPDEGEEELGMGERLLVWTKRNWRGVIAAGAMAAASTVHAAGPSDVIRDRGIQEIEIEAGARMGSVEMEQRFAIEAKHIEGEIARQRSEMEQRIALETARRNADDEAELKMFDAQVYASQEQWKLDPRMNLQAKDSKLAEFVAKRKQIELRQESRFAKWRIDVDKQRADFELRAQKRKADFANQVARERAQYQMNVAKQRNQADTNMNREILRGMKGKDAAAAGALILLGKGILNR